MACLLTGSGNIASGQQSDHLLMAAAYDAWATAKHKVGSTTVLPGSPCCASTVQLVYEYLCCALTQPLQSLLQQVLHCADKCLASTHAQCVLLKRICGLHNMINCGCTGVGQRFTTGKRGSVHAAGWAAGSKGVCSKAFLE